MRGARWPAQDKAATPIRPERKGTARKKGPRKERKKEKRLLRKELGDRARDKNRAQVVIENPPLARATPLHSVALRAARVNGKEKPEDLAD